MHAYYCYRRDEILGPNYRCYVYDEKGNYIDGAWSDSKARMEAWIAAKGYIPMWCAHEWEMPRPTQEGVAE